MIHLKRNLTSYFLRYNVVPGNTSGRKCTKVEEGGSGWGNTYICVPNGSHYNFVWGRSGQISGYDCSRWYEPNDGNWNDNYLCGTVSTGEFS